VGPAGGRRRLRQIVSRAVASGEVVDIFTAAGLRKPDISILSDEFLAEVRGMPQRNLAVELLQKLLHGEIRTRSRRNVVEARSFAEMLERSLRQYQNRAIETAQVIEELIALAKGDRARGQLHRRPAQVAVRAVRRVRAPVSRSGDRAGRAHAARGLPRYGRHVQGEWNPSDYAIHLTRRARGLPFWFSLATHGTQAYSDAIEATIALAREIADDIRRRAYVELVVEPELSVVAFRRLGWGREDFERWSDRLLRSGTAFVTPTRHRGETVTRFAIVSPRTTLADLTAILATMA